LCLLTEYCYICLIKQTETMRTYTEQQQKAIDSQLRENRVDVFDQLNEVDETSDKWWSLKETEMKISNLLMFGSYEEKNQTAQIIIL